MKKGKLKFFKIIQSILAGLIGVQHSKKMEEDSNTLQAKDFIIFGIIALIIFILSLVSIVSYVI